MPPSSPPLSESVAAHTEHSMAMGEAATQPFFKAIRQGNKQKVVKLLRLHPGLSAQRTLGDKTALLVAADVFWQDIGDAGLGCLNALLSVSDSTARTTLGATALHLAAERGNATLVAALLPYCDARAVDNDGETPLMKAASAGSSTCVQLLLAHSDPLLKDQSGFNAFMWAAWGGNKTNEGLNCLQVLLPHGGAQEADEEGLTALMWAAKGSDSELLKWLLGVANINAVDGQGRTALMHAAAADKVNQVRQLLPHADPTIADHKGCTALIHAVLGGHERCVEALAHWQPQRKDLRGRTALDIAIKKRHWDCVEALVLSDAQAGARVQSILEAAPEDYPLPRCRALFEREKIRDSMRETEKGRLADVSTNGDPLHTPPASALCVPSTSPGGTSTQASGRKPQRL